MIGGLVSSSDDGVLIVWSIVLAVVLAVIVAWTIRDWRRRR